jgi:NADH:ubiquinone oxidoreductase subunit 5 (subunit L)/multisubunit Na+/H+ antiporter MnhA subunit
MPWTGSAMILGAVAIAALPPLNGFVGKWLMYLGLLNYGAAAEGTASLMALLAVGLLALIGGLAAMAFVRLVGIVLLGSSRSDAASHAHESSPWMVGPMLVLLLACFAIAVYPRLLAGLTAGVHAQLLPAGVVPLNWQAYTAPVDTLGIINLWALVALVLTAGGLLALTRTTVRADAPTWGCGYLRPSSRMQYTGRSFAEMLAEHLLPEFLRPRTSSRLPQGLFPNQGAFAAECEDPLREKFYEPLFARWGNRFSRLRVLQQGKIHVYLVYIVFMVVVALSWVSVRAWWAS